MHVYVSTRARLFGNYTCRMHWSHQYVKEILEMDNSSRNAERQGKRTKRREFMNIQIVLTRKPVRMTIVETR